MYTHESHKHVHGSRSKGSSRMYSLQYVIRVHTRSWLRMRFFFSPLPFTARHFSIRERVFDASPTSTQVNEENYVLRSFTPLLLHEVVLLSSDNHAFTSR